MSEHGDLGPLLVVTGPTASGKTALAMRLAQIFDGELVGADSVQVYRGFDIGSAKPTPEELAGVPHHMLDVASPDAPLDAARFADLADAAIADVRSRRRVPIVVGGSGLWLRALLRGLVQLPEVDPELRARLQARAEAEGSPALHARLREVDPRAAESIHPNDSMRIVRALEVFEQLGKPLGELRAEHALGAPRYRALRIVLDPPDEVLTPRIEARVSAMLEAGLVDEVRTLVERHGRDNRALGAVGYAQLLPHVCDAASLPEARVEVVRATRIYARRQRTWLRNEPGELWCVDSAEPVLADAGLARLRQHLGLDEA